MKGKNESPKGETATFFFFVLAARGAWVPNDGRIVFPIKSFLLWWPRWPIFFLALIICSNCCPSDSNRPELSVCALCRYLHVISSYRRDHRSWRPTCLPATTFSIIETSLYIRPSFLSSQPYSADSTGLWITSDERLTWINLRRHFISKWAPTCVKPLYHRTLKRTLWRKRVCWNNCFVVSIKGHENKIKNLRFFALFDTREASSDHTM